MPALRLSHKLFLAFALITGVVLSLASWSLLTTRRLTAENRTIIDRALPAVRLEVALLEGVAALRRLEARHALLRDPAYVRLFGERARAVEGDLATLGDLVSTPEERQTLTEAAGQLRSYRALGERPPAETSGCRASGRAARDPGPAALRALQRRATPAGSRGGSARRAESPRGASRGRDQPRGVRRHRRLREPEDRPPPPGAPAAARAVERAEALRAHPRARERRDRGADDRLQPDGGTAQGARYPQAAALLGDHPRPQDTAHGHLLVGGPAREGRARHARRAPGVAAREHPDEHGTPLEPGEPAPRSRQAQDRQAPAGSRSDRRGLAGPGRGGGDPAVGRGPQPASGGRRCRTRFRSSSSTRSGCIRCW